ncbi:MULTISPECIES: helix-turn-helix transcriptional regulator [Mycolicibacter]|uniref:Helix-turn-helix transcriptional regulator n=2 Tax=Mycolicibacter TaxID=1073531 RepID=A0ABU5XNA1_9MYCO|nr:MULTISPECIES: helix-turn-helix transcriptional regulator [unclassified Mycolicibacter]MEB3023459.1 helix-turn-helix transcriptional regulator [Mycolicibacter sp. MYC098]MEB3033802.1 helix-turn-helix transcriptional regulator [Mycolicibacter sp. MYC340]
MTAPGDGNVRLRAARESIGLGSQPAFVKALGATAEKLGYPLTVTTRTVSRWESASPPWPHAHHIKALEELFGRPLTELGFTPRKTSNPDTPVKARRPLRLNTARRIHHDLPDSVIDDYIEMTACYRRLYGILPVNQLQPAANNHSQLGLDILDAVSPTAHAALADSVAEACLISGRIALFDRGDPEDAHAQFIWALECAQEATNDALGAAILAHMAFGPAISEDPARAEEARDQVRAARAFAKRAEDPIVLNAWIDAVDAEVETRLGDTARALQLIRRAEESYDPSAPTPDWLDWFSPAQLDGFKGNALLAAGHSHEARLTLERVLADLPPTAHKLRAITYADLGAAAAVLKEPEKACYLLVCALDELALTWYSTAMARVKAVRSQLRQWEGTPAVRSLDERLYDWTSTINALT